MTTDPLEHDFDWVSARARSSTRAQFECLRSDVRAMLEPANRFHEEHQTGERLAMMEHERGTLFAISATEPDEGTAEQPAVVAGAAFKLHDDRITVRVRVNRTPDSTDVSYTLTTKVDWDVGECYYTIDRDDDEVDLLRWEVLQRLLEPVVFP